MDRRAFLVRLAAGAVAGSTVLAGCGEDETADQPATVLQLGDTVNEANPEVTAERFFADRFNALTNGRYRVDVVPNGTLGDHNKMNQQVRAGTLHLTKTLFANLSAFDKRLGALSLPYVFARQEDLFAALDGQLGKECTSILDKYDLVVLAYFDSGARNIYNKVRPIRTPDDVKGLRLRVPQDVVAIDMVNHLGGQATPMATNEIYSALSQGVIDGAENNPIFYLTNKHVEQATYWSWTRHQFGVDALLASKKWMADLRPEDRDALVAAGGEAQIKERELWRSHTEQAITEVVAKGAVVNDDVDVAAFRRAVQPLYTKHRDSFVDLMRLLPV